jgi:hypothetical protein
VASNTKSPRKTTPSPVTESSIYEQAILTGLQHFCASMECIARDLYSVAQSLHVIAESYKPKTGTKVLKVGQANYSGKAPWPTEDATGTPGFRTR